MKHIYILLLCSVVTASSYAQSTVELIKLDDMIDDPFPDKILTDRAFDKSIYKDQQAIGGSTIKEGKVVGFNATVDEKSLTINGGTNIGYLGNTGFVLQGTLKGQSEENFVTIFSGGDYGKTLGAGGTLLVFLPTNTSSYYVTDRKQLHNQLRKLRNEHEGQEYPDFEVFRPKTGVSWVTPIIPKDYASWYPAQVKALQDLAKAFRELQSAQRTVQAANPGLSDKELLKRQQRDPAVRRAETACQVAEAKVTDLLPTYPKKGSKPLKSKWRYMSDKDKSDWLDQYVNPAPINTIKTDGATEIWLKMQWFNANQAIREKRLDFYDSLQVAAPSSKRRRIWLSVSGLSNVASQPVFDIHQPKDGYKRDFHDYYFDGLVSYNSLKIRPWLKRYFSFGVGLNTMRPFDKKDRITYLATSPTSTGFDSVQVIKQTELYPVIPANAKFTVIQAQYSLYFNKLFFGLDFTAKGKYDKDYQRNSLTLGIFAPIQAGETTLQFMPQLRWDDSDDHPFSFGFNLSASIPGFVTKSK